MNIVDGVTPGCYTDTPLCSSSLILAVILTPHSVLIRMKNGNLSLPCTVLECGGSGSHWSYRIICSFVKNEGSGYWIISLEATFQKRPKKNWTKPEKPSTEFLSQISREVSYYQVTPVNAYCAVLGGTDIFFRYKEHSRLAVKCDDLCEIK